MRTAPAEEALTAGSTTTKLLLIEERTRSSRLARALLGVIGLAVLTFLWWIGTNLLPAPGSFVRNFSPTSAFASAGQLLVSSDLPLHVYVSLKRILVGLALALLIGVPTGLAVGSLRWLEAATTPAFQFLRMISPLSWMPIAVMAFATWDGAIVFLIAVAAVWPILFSTAAGLRRVDPSWFKVARNLGARPWHMLFVIILPAISQDILTGIRLALGVAWIVLVPAEYLGVTSGLGYSINDARDTLEYDRLAATVVIIGVIGFLLDFACQQAISKLSWHRED